jgi:chromosome segregation ATPase
LFEKAKVIIGEKQISISNKFTLILLKSNRDYNLKLNMDDYEKILNFKGMIPLKIFIKSIMDYSEENSILEAANESLLIVQNSLRNLNMNKELLQSYIKLDRELIHYLNYIKLVKVKDALSNRLKFLKVLRRKDELSALSDLISKLENTINDKTKQLHYLEQDFLRKKMQWENIKEDHDNLTEKGRILNNKKKLCFDNINAITRRMELGLHYENDIIIDEDFIIDARLKDSEKVRKLQSKAKETQFQINTLIDDLSKSETQITTYTPEYETIKHDYMTLKDQIEEDRVELSKKQGLFLMELGKDQLHSFDSKIDLTFNSKKSIKEIEGELDKVKMELDALSLPESPSESIIGPTLKIYSEKLKAFKTQLIKKEKHISMLIPREQIKARFDGFSELELKVYGLEKIANLFLHEINLDVFFTIDNITDGMEVLVSFKFSRKSKSSITFENLTTPEKIYFLLSFYFSIKVIQGQETIFFTNLIFPDEYNKRGSIFRTIRKIIPVFKRESSLNEFSLIFLISNLELKKEIENIHLIKLDES